MSGLGSDTNNCLITTPCKSFQGALNKTNAGGQIVVLDSGGYAGGSTLTIGKAISIINQGNFAGISVASGGIGIVINAQPGDAVFLSGLTIDGYSLANTTGIQFNGGALIIENCIVRNMTNDGIDILSNSTNKIVASVSNTLVANNGGDGILVQPLDGPVSAVFSRVEADNNVIGIEFNGASDPLSITVTVADSVAFGNSVGFNVAGGAGVGGAGMMITRSMAANNSSSGLLADSATMLIGQSTISGNAHGWTTLGNGVVQSYGTNQGNDNGSDQGQPPAVVGGFK